MGNDRWEVRENGQVLYRLDMPADQSDAALDMSFLYADERMAAHPEAHIQIFRNKERVFDSAEDAKSDHTDAADNASEELSAWSTEDLVSELRARDGVAAYVLELYESTDVHADGPAVVLVVTD